MNPEDVIEVKRYDNYTSITYGTKSIIRVEKDEFKNKTIIYFWMCCASSINKLWFYDDVELGVGFKVEGDTFYLLAGCYQKQLKLNIGDEIQFLFEDKTIKSFSLTEKGKRFEKEEGGITLESKIQLTQNEFDFFINNKVGKIRFIDNKKSIKEKYSLNEKSSQDFVNMAKNIKHAFDNYK